MIENLLLQILNMSFIGGIVIVFILIARIFLKKAPKIFSYSLWAVALLRLMFPFSFESILSLIPVNPVPVPRDILYHQTPHINTGITQFDQLINASMPAAAVYDSVNPMQVWIFAGSILWIAGILVLLAYSLVSFLTLHRKLKYAKNERDNIYISSNIETPFVLGIINPRIYLPEKLNTSEKAYIILHEQTHIRRLDHITKIIGFLALCIHWFNPLVWIAFYISGQDMEMSCDESVIKQLGDGVKKDYSSSLLALATGKRLLSATPLAFGEGDTEGRIKNVIHYKKPVFWVVAVAVIAVLAISIGLMSNPQSKQLSVEEHAELYVKEVIESYESANSQAFKVVEHKITSLNKLARFESILDFPIELWTIEYRIKPDNIQNVMFAGGMNEIDGWITEDSSMGKPVLIFSFENNKSNLLGVIWSGETGLSRLADQETALRVFMERRGALPGETYAGNHVVVKFPASSGEIYQLFLSQPVTQTDKGIWCVERWMDGNGTVYHVTPDTELLIEDYYKKLQGEADNGQEQWLKDPLQVANTFIHSYLGQAQISLNDLVPKYSATLEDFMETPESTYIGYISNFEESFPNLFHFDPVEWLTLEDNNRLEALNIDSNELPNGYYIHNEVQEVYSFKLNEDTEYNFIDWGNNFASSDDDRFHYSTKDKGEFIQYLTTYTDYAVKVPFWIITKDGFVQSITEQYVP